MNKIVILGANGQLGQCLEDELKLAERPFIALTRSDCDITNIEAIKKHLSKNSCVINCAAYTAVDAAESDSNTAHQINAEGAKNVAQVCDELGIPLIHISTDYVFNGSSDTPYKTDSPTEPLGVYGQSKLEGERYVCEQCPSALVIRTAWVFSEYGKNFVKTMLNLGKQRNALNIVADQIGKPTYARDLARVVINIATHLEQNSDNKRHYSQIYHFTNEEQTSWSDFAREIFKQAHQVGLLDKLVAVEDIPSSDYPTPAARPMYSVLDNSLLHDDFSVTPRSWREALMEMLEYYAK